MSSRKGTLFSIRAPLPKRTAFILGLVAPVLVLGAWCVLTYGGFVQPDFLPKPTEVVRGTLQLFLHHDLAMAILVSTRRIAIAFLLASLIALPLGVLMGAFDPINRFFEPIMAPLRYMPISAFIPLLILWFGIYEKQKIAFLYFGVEDHKDYHKPSDEIKPDWDLSGAVEDAQFLLAVGYRIAQGDKWPEWKPGTEFKAKRDESLKAAAGPA